jgi:hypothetical protein
MRANKSSCLLWKHWLQIDLIVLLLVVLPDPVVKESGQGEPSLIRQHEVSGHWVDVMEGDGCSRNGAPEQQKFVESLR